MSETIYRLPPDELKPHFILLAGELSEARDWGHTPLELAQCQKLALGEGVKIAILDTGIDLEHPDLRGRIEAHQDFTGSRTGSTDIAGHGTHVSGIAAAGLNNSGMIGAAPGAALLIGKVLGDQGSGTSSWIAAGIRWAVAKGANIINLSLGSPTLDPVIAAAVLEAEAAGVHVIAAAGNEGPGEGTIGYPGGLESPVCVGAVDSNLTPARFSSRGPQIDVAAPGVSIRSCYPGGRFAVLSGTSMATPYVSGCVALLLSFLLKKGLRLPSPADLLGLLKRHSKDLAAPGFDTATGYGLIQPLALLRSAVPEPPPPPEPPRAGVPAYLIAYDKDGRPLARYTPGVVGERTIAPAKHK